MASSHSPTVDNGLQILKSRPSEAEIGLVLAKLLLVALSNASQLALITTLLNHTVPETYLRLLDGTRNTIVALFLCATGLGNLVSRLFLLKDSSQLLENDPILAPFASLIGDLFQPGFLPKLVKNRPAAEVKEIDRLVFRGKCFSIVNEIALHQNIDFGPVFASSSSYVAFLNLGLLELYDDMTDFGTINMFLFSLGSINEDGFAQYFEVMFNDRNWHSFAASFREMKRFERKNVLLKFLTSFLTRKYLLMPLPKEKIVALCVISNQIFDSNLIDELLIEKIISTRSWHLNTVTGLLCAMLPAKDFEKMVLKSLSYWGNDHILKTEPILRQEHRTHILICLLAQCSSVFLMELLQNESFLRSITNRLSSLSNSIKALGVILADKMCEFGNMPKIFNMDNTGYELLQDRASYIKRNDVSLDNMEYAWELLLEPEVEEIEPDVTDLVSNFSTALLNKKADSDDDSDITSDEEDDPTIGQRTKISKPLYIKDLLEYLKVDTKAPQAYEKRRLALTEGPTLLHQKSTFGTEVSFHADELLTELCALANFFEESDFESLRLACMVAVLSCHPSSAVQICKLLLLGDYSLQQRMCILSATSLAARHLRGFEDDVITSSYRLKLFASKELPPLVSRAFLSLDSVTQTTGYGVDDIQKAIQQDLMREASEEANKTIYGGTLIRSSRALNRPKATEKTPKNKDFARLIGTCFFFPMVSVWYEAGLINIGHYSPILTGHFIKTLVLLLHAAYPVAANFHDMVRELVQIMVPLVKRVSIDELQVVESIVTGVLLICDVTEDEVLVRSYSGELRIIQEWLAFTWESVIDEKLKSLCAGLLLRLNGLGERFERVLMDQMGLIY